MEVNLGCDDGVELFWKLMILNGVVDSGSCRRQRGIEFDSRHRPVV